MSWGAQNRSKDAKTPSVARVLSENPELDLWPIQPYMEERMELLQAMRVPSRSQEHFWHYHQ
jgi:hypothetical protein